MYGEIYAIPPHSLFPLTNHLLLNLIYLYFQRGKLILLFSLFTMKTFKHTQQKGEKYNESTCIHHAASAAVKITPILCRLLPHYTSFLLFS